MLNKPKQVGSQCPVSLLPRHVLEPGGAVKVQETCARIGIVWSGLYMLFERLRLLDGRLLRFWRSTALCRVLC